MELLGITGQELLVVLSPALFVAAVGVGVVRLVRKAAADGARDVENQRN